MPVDLVPRWVKERASFSVSREHELRAEIRQAELADVENGQIGVFAGVWAEVPRVDFVLADLQAVEILHASDFGDALRHGARCS